mmetsp:Transcript_23277/g.65416  ORF Transcript_23277/g.65416 Transcript_23277/m.65416 type:complete len:130 (+) Transcript_23277:83-472(+)
MPTQVGVSPGLRQDQLSSRLCAVPACKEADARLLRLARCTIFHLELELGLRALHEPHVAAAVLSVGGCKRALSSAIPLSVDVSFWSIASILFLICVHSLCVSRKRIIASRFNEDTRPSSFEETEGPPGQ